MDETFINEIECALPNKRKSRPPWLNKCSKCGEKIGRLARVRGTGFCQGCFRHLSNAEKKVANLKCDWCGRRLPSKMWQTGTFVYQNLTERRGHICQESCEDKLSGEETRLHQANPIFENEIAWAKWKKKHPKYAVQIMATGGPGRGHYTTIPYASRRRR